MKGNQQADLCFVYATLAFLSEGQAAAGTRSSLGWWVSIEMKKPIFESHRLIRSSKSGKNAACCSYMYRTSQLGRAYNKCDATSWESSSLSCQA